MIKTTEIKEYNFSDKSSEERTDVYITFECVCGEDMALSDYESETCEACGRYCYYDRKKTGVFCNETMKAHCKVCKKDVEYDHRGSCPDCDETVAEVED